MNDLTTTTEYTWTYRVPAKEVRVGRVILTPDGTGYEVLEVGSPWVGVVRFTVRTAGYPEEFPVLVSRNEQLHVGSGTRKEVK